jgi:hypothetical protein
MNDSERSCWNCAYQQIGGDSFLGMCTFFSHVGKPNKEIPANIADVGCKQWAQKAPTGDRANRPIS